MMPSTRDSRVGGAYAWLSDLGRGRYNVTDSSGSCTAAIRLRSISATVSHRWTCCAPCAKVAAADGRSLSIRQPDGAGLQPEAAAAYLQRLEREIEQLGYHAGPLQAVEQLRLSVGTLGIEALRRLLNQLKRRFAFVEPHAGSFWPRWSWPMSTGR